MLARGVYHARRWDPEAAEALLNRCASGAATLGLEDASQLAWREAIRCIGRLHWRSLQVVDA